jgi:hypothetical protein
MVITKNIVFFRFFFLTFYFFLLVILWFLLIRITIGCKHAVIFNHLCLYFFLIILDLRHKAHVHKIIHLLLLILRPNVLRFLNTFRDIGYPTCLFKLLFTCLIFTFIFHRFNCRYLILIDRRRRL